MTSEPIDGAPFELDTRSTSLQSEAHAIAILLAVAEASLQAHAFDVGFLGVLKGCRSRIRRRLNLADCDVTGEMQAQLASLGGILRLLDYVRLEIQDKLNDIESVGELEACIDRLAGTTRHIN